MRPLDIALQVASTGMPVFPCNSIKRPSVPKSEGGNGFKDATLDPDTIRIMFARRNATLVGVPTGQSSGIDALDFDYRNGAADWEQTHLDALPETRIHETRSGGRHLIFHHAHGVRNTASKIAPGVDVRGEGGYIIIPPSEGYHVIHEAPVAHWPDWLLAVLLRRNVKAEAPLSPSMRVPASSETIGAFIDRCLNAVSAAAEGQKHFILRNQALLVGGIAAQSGIGDSQLVQMLVDALPGTCVDLANAKKTAEWGVSNGHDRAIELTERPKIDPEDPRNKETFRTAIRLLRMGVETGELIDSLADQNKRRPQPLPEDVIASALRWAARKLAGLQHAQ